MTVATHRNRAGTLSTRAKPKPVRVAIYTRKSTTEGLDSEFTTLDAQRGAVTSYVASQRALGWEVIPEKFDNGGFSGANTSRPAFQRLLAAIEAGDVDVVAVYKIDRLSRSLLDFLQTLQWFKKHGVTFVSVTQHFDTTTPMGQLTLNILVSFGQFERQIISERTRDKMAASSKPAIPQT